MLKIFQLKAARSTLGIGVRDVENYIKLSRTTISKIENHDYRSDLNINKEKTQLLIKIFNDKRVFFPDNKSIYFDKIDENKKNILSRFQLRGARSITGLSQQAFAANVNLLKTDINYLENLENHLNIFSTIKKIDTSHIIPYFNKTGIYFEGSSLIRIAY